MVAEPGAISFHQLPAPEECRVFASGFQSLKVPAMQTVMAVGQSQFQKEPARVVGAAHCS